jgi:cytochrome c oxidase subunit III
MNTQTQHTQKRIHTRKIILWVGIISIIMIFAGLTSAYIVRQAEGNWVRFELPGQFYISTAIILLSSVSLNAALVNIKKGKRDKTTLFLALTLLLGFGFVITQYSGWDALVKQGIYFVGNPSGSFLYVLTGLHVLHLLAGLIALMVTLVRSKAGKYTVSNYLGIELCAIYWHFLGGLWVYLFFFLLLIR